MNSSISWSCKKNLASRPNVRTVADNVPDPELFIYPFLTKDLFRFSQTSLPRQTKIHILRCALRGMADMLDRGVLYIGKLNHPNVADFYSTDF